MIENKKILAIIPARGGSKGVPRKNIYKINGRPLISFTINEAKKSKYLDKILVSSEDDEILDVSSSLGAETIRRPRELALDQTPGIDAVLHAIAENPGFDFIVLLQPTSPLRSVVDIDNTIEFCITRKFPCCVTLTETEENPYWMFNITEDHSLIQLISGKIPSRRQDAPQIYILNGAVYIAEVSWLLENKNFIYGKSAGYIMPKERSLDIDTIEDIRYLEYLLKEKH